MNNGLTHANPDEVLNVGWDKDNKDKAARTGKRFYRLDAAT